MARRSGPIDESALLTYILWSGWNRMREILGPAIGNAVFEARKRIHTLPIGLKTKRWCVSHSSRHGRKNVAKPLSKSSNGHLLG